MSDPNTSPDSADEPVVDPHWRSTTRARLVAAAGLAALAAAVTATLVATHTNPAGQDTDDAGGPVDATSSTGTTDSTSSSTAPSGSASSSLTGSSSPTSGPAGRPSGAGTTTPTAGGSAGATAGGPIGDGDRPTAPRRQSSAPSHRPSSHRPSPPRRTTSPRRPSTRPTSSTKSAPAFHAHWVYVAGPAAFAGHRIGSYSSQLARSCADSSDLSACSTSGVQWGGGCSNLYYGARVPDGAPVGWAVWEFASGQCKYAMSAGNPGGD